MLVLLMINYETTIVHLVTVNDIGTGNIKIYIYINILNKVLKNYLLRPAYEEKVICSMSIRICLMMKDTD